MDLEKNADFIKAVKISMWVAELGIVTSMVISRFVREIFTLVKRSTF